MLSQFIGEHEGLRTLRDVDFLFPEGIHAIGRLDYESEGLLLLTTDPSITKKLYQSSKKHPRTYVVQGYKIISEATVEKLATGIPIIIKGGVTYTTKPCIVNLIARPTWLAVGESEIPDGIPNSWLEITLTEGKYRQVRKMMHAAGHKCRRLVRVSIEDIKLEGLQPGEVVEISKEGFFSRLKLE